MKRRLDMAKIAKALGAVRVGKVRVKGGYVGALGLLADVEARFRHRARSPPGSQRKSPCDDPVRKR
jgi:hypothetical protein